MSVPIDLMPFCSRDSFRSASIGEPFSREEWTYATNGHVMLRLPRRDDVPERADAPVAEKVWPTTPEPVFRAPKVSILPIPKEVECNACEGRGTKHDCPDCACVCKTCGGTGHVSDDAKSAVRIGEIDIATRYARLLMTLPGLLISDPPKDAYVFQFRFDGGEGILMPLREFHSYDRLDVEL